MKERDRYLKIVEWSGKFQLRLGSELHQALSIRAIQTGDSLNNFCVKSLKKSLLP